MSTRTAEMQTFAARHATFTQPYQLSKRRASSQGSKKKTKQTAEWPHEQPDTREVGGERRLGTRCIHVRLTPRAARTRRLLLQTRPGVPRQRAMLHVWREA